jgi:predicted transcriptional regulator
MLALYPMASESDRATVQKLLERLESKGYVERDRGSHAHVFSSTMSRTAFAGSQLATMAEKVSGGTLLPLVLHLVETKKLNSRERAKLRDILNESKNK